MLLMACSESGPVTLGSELAALRGALAGGEPDVERKAVVSLLTIMEDRHELCTATAIAPNLLLTARHCVAPTTADSVDCDSRSASFTAPHPVGALWAGRNDVLGAPLLELDYLRFRERDEDFVRVIEVHTPESDTVCDSDFAVLILEEPIAAAPLEPRLDQGVFTAELYTAVGFGGTSPVGEWGTRRSRSSLYVLCSPTDCEQPTIGAGEFLADAGICDGDSGAPAIAYIDGKVVGVASRTSAACDSSVFAAVWPFRALIREAGLRAALIGGYGAPDWVRRRPFVAGPVEAVSAPADAEETAGEGTSPAPSSSPQHTAAQSCALTSRSAPYNLACIALPALLWARRRARAAGGRSARLPRRAHRSSTR